MLVQLLRGMQRTTAYVICSSIRKLCPRLVYGLRNSGKPSRQHQTDQAYRKRGIFAIRWRRLLPQQ